MGAQYLYLDIREQHFGMQFRTLPSQQGHQHNASGNHHIDCYGTLQTFCCSMGRFFRTTTTLEHAISVFNTPTQLIPAYALLTHLRSFAIAKSLIFTFFSKGS